jgi:surface polysaccharide O-acyltransferase-like enzyme
MERVQGIDTFRVLAIFAVIIIHTSPFAEYNYGNYFYKYINLALNQASRFAVPFFFIVSGYLWGVKVRLGNCPILTAIRSIKRILFIFCIWSLIYLLPYNFETLRQSIYTYGFIGPIKLIYWDISDQLQNPLKLLMQGTSAHLWFLVALSLSMGISAVFIKRTSFNLLFIFSLMLYVYGVLAKSYANTPIGIAVEFNTRNGPFFGTFLFVNGYYLSGLKIKEHWLKIGFFVFIFGFMLHFLELYMLWKYFETPPIQDYVFGTALMGLGASIMSISNNSYINLKCLSGFGQLALGIYLVHIIIIKNLVKPADYFLMSIFWEISKPFLVFALSILLVSAMAKNKSMKRIIM